LGGWLGGWVGWEKLKSAKLELELGKKEICGKNSGESHGCSQK
jgi:hypothetical protein